MHSTNIEERLNIIEARLAIIESKIDSAPTPESLSSATSQLSEEVRATKQIQTSKSGNWLGFIATICFILAAGLIIKLSIESGWLTVDRQLGLPILFGLALIGAGLALLKTDRNYASLLPAAGLIIFYITAFSAHRFYFLISFQTTIALTAVITGLSIWFYIKIKHDIYAVIAALIAYIGPSLLHHNGNLIFILYFSIICSLTFSTFSIWIQSRTLTVISAYLAILDTAFIGFNLGQNILISVVLGLHFFIFSMGTYFHTQLTHHNLTEKESWSFFPVLLVFYAMEYYFIDKSYYVLAPWVSLCFAGLLICLYLSAKKWFPERSFNSQEMILAFTTVVCFHSIYLELLPIEIRPWLFILIIIGFCYVFKTYHPKITRAYVIPLIALFTVMGMEYISMITHLVAGLSLPWIIVSATAFVSLWTMILFYRDDLVKNDENIYLFTLAATHLLGISGFYQLTVNYGSLAISVSWLFYAACVVDIAYLRKDKIMAKSALIILVIATGKALLYDVSATPTATSILCLLLTGIVLYISGFFIRKMTGH